MRAGYSFPLGSIIHCLRLMRLTIYYLLPGCFGVELHTSIRPALLGPDRSTSNSLRPTDEVPPSPSVVGSVMLVNEARGCFFFPH